MALLLDQRGDEVKIMQVSDFQCSEKDDFD